MKKKFITTWRITIFALAAVLFIQLFSLFNTASDSVRVGRVVVPQSYLEPTAITTNQLTYK